MKVPNCVHHCGWGLFEELGGGHGGHGGHGDCGHRDVSEDGLAAAAGRHLVLAKGADDHLPHLSAGVTANGQKSLDVLLPAGAERRIDRRRSTGFDDNQMVSEKNLEIYTGSQQFGLAL